MSSRAAEVGAAIRRVADGENALGMAFPREVVEDLLAGMILFAPQTGEPDDETLELLGRLGVRADVRDNDDQATAARKVATYLTDRPPHPVLLDAVITALMALVERGAIDRASSLGRFIGNEASKRPVGTGEPPPGSVAGGLGALLYQRTRKD